MKSNILGVLTLFTILSFLFFLNKKESQLEFALRFAGNNRLELEKVIEHYRNNPQKLFAACFLIENMPYHYSVDKNYSKTLQPVYGKYEIISLLSH